jgi:hypothetical protein
MYCYFGHRIRALHAGVLNAAYQSHWVQGSEVSRSAAIMIATVASCPNAISQIGSPFFSLSMETFTSVSKKNRHTKGADSKFYLPDYQRCDFLLLGASPVQAGRAMISSAYLGRDFLPKQTSDLYFVYF